MWTHVALLLWTAVRRQIPNRIGPIEIAGQDLAMAWL